MKNPFLSFFAAMLLIIAVPFSASAQRNSSNTAVAHFDLDSLIKVMPEYKKASDDAEAYYEMLENQLIKLQKELDAKMARYDSLKDGSQIIKSLIVKEIVDLQQNIQTYQTAAQTDYARKRAELFDPIYEKIRNAAKAVALRRGYKYVIDSSKSSAMVIYASAADDIFMDMLKELGIALPAPTPADKAAPGK
ncbi:MAG: OmpH family outer membrane protein [Bacteroidia bacterium]|jgi:outer membrane protein|nr:OmpH family outer membrane protein [Bacteroidia bacterium]